MIIITAEEFLKSTELIVKFDNSQGCILEEELPKLMIEFAKIHVAAALNEAANEADVEAVDADMYGVIWGVDSNSILKSYPLTNIK